LTMLQASLRPGGSGASDEGWYESWNTTRSLRLMVACSGVKEKQVTYARQ